MQRLHTPSREPDGQGVWWGIGDDGASMCMCGMFLGEGEISGHLRVRVDGRWLRAGLSSFNVKSIEHYFGRSRPSVG